MLARTDSRIRAIVMLVVVVLVAGLIGYRLVWWQVIERERLAAMGMAQLAHAQQIPATRGLILDRDGLSSPPPSPRTRCSRPRRA
jgi:cell division protein FtsI/penicillin-binding protein 2